MGEESKEREEKYRSALDKKSYNQYILINSRHLRNRSESKISNPPAVQPAFENPFT